MQRPYKTLIAEYVLRDYPLRNYVNFGLALVRNNLKISLFDTERSMTKTDPSRLIAKSNKDSKNFSHSS